ncbi:phosphomannomutase/phosphoglucomutase, partial [Ventosimonas gracilis]|uniref:phosphomannomutase/phosphoglucomutase n=1 Tax=Ventosimonas gracilis TaxID=1680762 RepID=UPI000B2F4D37
PIGSAVMLTGSHNPPEYNGFKILRAGEPLSAEQIQLLRRSIKNEDFVSGQGVIRKQSIFKDYCAALGAGIYLARPLKIVIDCANGATGLIAPRLFKALGCEVIPLFAEVDGRFPNHPPDPSRAENLQSLIQAVKDSRADMGLAFDGDGDRLGVVTNSGRIIPADQLLMLFAGELLTQHPGVSVVFDVKCSYRLPEWIKKQGGKPLMVKTGRTHIREAMRQNGALLGGELSGHFCFADRWNGFDDALYAAARLLQTLSQSEKTSDALAAELPQDCATEEITIAVADEEKFALIDRLQQQAEFSGGQINRLDGIRVDWPRGFGLIRASNTSPALTLRFAAEDETELKRIQQLFAKQLQLVLPTFRGILPCR